MSGNYPQILVRDKIVYHSSNSLIFLQPALFFSTLSTWQLPRTILLKLNNMYWRGLERTSTVKSNAVTTGALMLALLLALLLAVVPDSSVLVQSYASLLI